MSTLNGFLHRGALLCALLTVLLLCAAPVPSAHAATLGRALVTGSADNGNEGNNLRSSLESLGFAVDRTADVPADLSGYQSVWYVEAYAGLDSDERDRLVAFSRAGGNLYLTGERPCCETLNAGVQDVLDRTLKDTNVQVGGLGDINGPFAFNSDVTDHVATVPNFLVDFIPHSPGGMAGIGGVSSRNVLASSSTTPVGAVWSEGDLTAGRGRIALLMDIDWLNDSDRVPIVENLANFLSAGGLCFGENGSGLSWTSGPANCTAINTPATVSWTVTAAGGGAPPTIAVTASGATADCDYSSAGSAATARCRLTEAAPEGAALRVVATGPSGETVRHYRVRPKNDPRNVPVPFAEDSNWWSWPDRDDDGLPDWWEEHGVWVKGTLLDLPSLGADPDHKDLFLHYDFQSGEEQTDTTLNTMKSMFSSAPLANPDGSSGIRLHIERGASIPSSVVGDFALTNQDIVRVGTYSGYLSSPEYGGSGVPPIYKWMLNFSANDAGKHRLCGGKTSDGCGGIKGQFAWTATGVDGTTAALSINLPVWNSADRENARAFSEASNATHELGHLLGLLHHGAESEPADDKSYKSVMSYAYSHFGLPGDGFLPEHHLDYSRLSSPNLDWRLGKELGRLTFVSGQDGEIPDFYANASDDALVPIGDAPKGELDEQEALQAATPESIKSFISEFHVPAAPDIPTLQGATATVRAGEAVDVDLHGLDPAGATLSYVLSTPATLGTATATRSGLHYVARPDAGGDETLTVRAVNGTLGSDEASVVVHVLAAPPAPGGGTPGGGGTTGSGGVTPHPAACVAPRATRSASVAVSPRKAARTLRLVLGRAWARRTAKATLLKGCVAVAHGSVRGRTLRLVVKASGKRRGAAVYPRLRGTYTLVLTPAKGAKQVVTVRLR